MIRYRTVRVTTKEGVRTLKAPSQKPRWGFNVEVYDSGALSVILYEPGSLITPPMEVGRYDYAPGHWCDVKSGCFDQPFNRR